MTEILLKAGAQKCRPNVPHIEMPVTKKFAQRAVTMAIFSKSHSNCNFPMIPIATHATNCVFTDKDKCSNSTSQNVALPHLLLASRLAAAATAASLWPFLFSFISDFLLLNCHNARLFQSFGNHGYPRDFSFQKGSREIGVVWVLEQKNNILRIGFFPHIDTDTDTMTAIFSRPSIHRCGL